jgi:hypothetical protein
MSEHDGWGPPTSAPADPWAPPHDVLASGHADRSPRPRRHRRAAILAALAAIAVVLAAGAWAWQDRARQTDELLDAIKASEATMVEGQETLATSALDYEERLAAATPERLPALQAEAEAERERLGSQYEALMRERIDAVEALSFRPWNSQAADTQALYLTHQAAWAELFAAAGRSEVTPEIEAEISRSWDAFTPALTDLGYDDESRATIAVIIGPTGDGQGGGGGDPNTIQA